MQRYIDYQYITKIIMLNNVKHQCMNLKERLIDLISLEGLNPNQFYKSTGLGIGFLDKVGNKLKRPSIDKISSTFPKWNIDYLQTGEGEKYHPDNANNVQGNGNASVAGNGNTSVAGNGNQITNSNLSEMIELQKGYQEMLKTSQRQLTESQQQINRLITIIEKSNEKQQ